MIFAHDEFENAIAHQAKGMQSERNDTHTHARIQRNSSIKQNSTNNILGEMSAINCIHQSNYHHIQWSSTNNRGVSFIKCPIPPYVIECPFTLSSINI